MRTAPNICGNIRDNSELSMITLTSMPHLFVQELANTHIYGLFSLFPIVSGVCKIVRHYRLLLFILSMTF